jgi:hypothetical protein
MSQDHNHLNHATWECKYHVVFTPKCRKKMLMTTRKVNLQIHGIGVRGLASDLRLAWKYFRPGSDEVTVFARRLDSSVAFDYRIQFLSEGRPRPRPRQKSRQIIPTAGLLESKSAVRLWCPCDRLGTGFWM